MTTWGFVHYALGLVVENADCGLFKGSGLFKLALELGLEEGAIEFACDRHFINRYKYIRFINWR